jgi:hypothetical protein
MNAIDIRPFLARSYVDVLSPRIFPARSALARTQSGAPPFGYLLPHGHPGKTTSILRAAFAKELLPEVVVYLATSHFDPTPFVLPCAVRTHDGDIPTVVDWLDRLPSRLVPAVSPFECDHSWRQDLPFLARQSGLACRPLRQLSILVGSMTVDEIRAIIRHLQRVAWECFSHVTFVATGDFSHVGKRFESVPGGAPAATRDGSLTRALVEDTARLKMLAERRSEDFRRSMDSSSACARNQAIALSAEAPLAGHAVAPLPVCFFQGSTQEMLVDDWFYVAGAVRYPALPRPAGVFAWDRGDAVLLRGLFGDVTLADDAAQLFRTGRGARLERMLREHPLAEPPRPPPRGGVASAFSQEPPVVRWSSGSQGAPKMTEHSREAVAAQGRHARATHRRLPATVRLARPANLLNRDEYQSGEYWFPDINAQTSRVSPGVDPAAVDDARWLDIGERLIHAGTRVLHGEPAYLAGLAASLAAEGRMLPNLLHVEVGHGPLPLPALAVLRRVFPAARVERMYHTSEFGPLAIACPRGVLHLQESRLRFALAAGRGPRELLVTDVGPTIRTPRTSFSTGDLVDWAEPCACGARGRAIRLVGRAREHDFFARVAPRGGLRRLEQALAADGVGPLYRFDISQGTLFVPASRKPLSVDRTVDLLKRPIQIVAGIPATEHPAKYTYYRLEAR